MRGRFFLYLQIDFTVTPGLRESIAILTAICLIFSFCVLGNISFKKKLLICLKQTRRKKDGI